MTRATVFLLAVLLLGGCADAAEVLVDNDTTELRGSEPTPATPPRNRAAPATEPSSGDTDGSRHPASPTPPPATDPAAGYWWSTDPAQVNDAFERCGQPDSRWRLDECRFIGGLFRGTHETYADIVVDHGVDLLGAGWSMCHQMDRYPGPDQFDANLVPPDNWPADTTPRFDLVYIAAIASQTLCDQHIEIGAWLMTPREAEPTAGPST